MSPEQLDVLMNGLIILLGISLLGLPIYFLFTHGDAERNKEAAAKAHLRQLEEERDIKDRAKWKVILERRNRAEDIAQLVSHTEPHSDEERKLLNLADAMNMTHDEWNMFNYFIVKEQSPPEYLPKTRPHIFCRQIKAIESEMDRARSDEHIK